MRIELNATGQSRGGQVGPLNPMPVTSAGTDSNGNALPADFCSLPVNTNTVWVAGFPTVKTWTVESGEDTYTKTKTYTNDGTNITDTSASGWAKS
jgi:hypothetical protein